MLREAYRRGSVRYPVKLRLKSGSPLKSLGIALRLLSRSALRVIANVPWLLLQLPRGHANWAPPALRVADSIGTMAGVFQLPNRHYRPAG